MEYKSLHLGLLCQTLLVISSKMIYHKMLIALPLLLSVALGLPVDEKPPPVELQTQVSKDVNRQAVDAPVNPEIQTAAIQAALIPSHEAPSPVEDLGAGENEADGRVQAEEKSDLETANTFWGGWGGGYYRRPYYGYGGWGGSGWRRGWGGYGYGRGFGGYGGYGGWGWRGGYYG